MTAKDHVIDLLRHLPDDVSVDEIKRLINAIDEVVAADHEIDRGQGLPHQGVMAPRPGSN